MSKMLIWGSRMTKHCKDCKHALTEVKEWGDQILCKLDEMLPKFDDDLIEWLVSGIGDQPTQPKYFSASTTRGYAGNCGVEGRLFEPKKSFQ
jgi:hypothetical protein